MNKFIEKLQHKLDTAKEDSDFSYFFSLLIVGEALTKIITLMSLSALKPDIDRHQYRLLHGVVRASGIGDWSKAIDDLLSGTASQHLISNFREFQAELTKKTTEDEWQNLAVSEIVKSLESLNITCEVNKGKKDLRSWFRYFTELRNKTRGHGATQIGAASGSAPHLEKSIQLILHNLSLFSVPTAYLKRNLSGKYRVTEIGSISDEFDEFKINPDLSVDDGVYIFLGEPRKLPLLLSDSDLTDFYIANGSFTNTKYELISYITDDKKYGNSSDYQYPVGELPPSESEGLGELEVKGTTFTNVPSLSYDYIERQELEDQLFELLIDDRRAVITLLGRGGIGKTSLALKVIPRLYNEERFDAIIWFSSRDIDLQTDGAKIVTAEVVSNKDISVYYSKLVLSVDKLKDKKFNPIDYFQRQLTSSDTGACLFVFDNFETTSNPIEVFKWIDTYIRSPNKILITTRLREFLGDYPITVHGMTKSESEDLINLTANQLSIRGGVSKGLIDEIYKVSAGHPYIIKIMLGELSKNNMKGSLPKIIASSDEVLTALFERTYSALNPCTQRVFLTLSSWNSAVSRLALESVLMSSIDEPLEVERSIDTLVQYSLVEEFMSEADKQYFISLPFTAMSFGEKKLKVSPLRSSIAKDVKFLQKFGPTKQERKDISLEPHIKKFLSSLENPKQDYETHKELLERIGLSFVSSLPIFAIWLEESGDPQLLKEARRYLYLYLERSESEEYKYLAWAQLAKICRELNEPVEEVHALIESSQYTQVEFYDLSNVVNKINHMLSKDHLVLDDHDIKTETLSKLYEVVCKRKSEGDATDLSRIAWLALHLNKEDEARELVDFGLNIDESNRFCLKLMQKLDRTITSFY